MPVPGKSSEDAELKDLTKLLQSYRDKDGSINPDRAPPDMKDLLQRLQDEQHKAQARRASEGVTIVPEPCFVVKTADSAGSKVFINMCSAPQVAVPAGFQQGQMTDVMMEAIRAAEDTGEVAEVLRFPLSLGSFRVDVDKKGESCHVLDIVLNPDVLKQAQAFRPLKTFLVELAMAWAAKKHGVQLDPAWKLPKMRYKGGAVQPQLLRLDRGPMVNEIGDVPEPPSFPLAAEKKQPKPLGKSGATPQGPPARLQEQPHAGTTEHATERAAEPATGDATAAAAANPSQAPAAAQAGSRQSQGSSETGAAMAADKGVAAVGPAASSSAARSSAPAQQPVPGLPELAHSVSFVGRPVEAVQVAVSLTEPSSVASGSRESLCVEVAGDQVFVAVPGHAPLALTLPFGVDAISGAAQLSEDGRQLRLSLPFKPHRIIVEEAKRSCATSMDSYLFLDSPLMQLDV